MGFLLTVVSGAGEGSEFAFDAAEARLGRTADNDVVVKDAAASRSHARVYGKSGKFFVEDLGSANGTRVNNAAIKTPRELKPGDDIAIGDVIIRFSLDDGAVDDSDGEDNEQDDEQDDEHDNGEEEEAGDDDQGDDEESDAGQDEDEAPPPRALARSARSPSKASLKRGRAAADEDEESSAADGEDAADGSEEEEQLPARRSSKSIARPSRVSSAPARSSKGAAPASAADRARQRRELQKSSAGRFQLIWQDLPRAARSGIIAALIVVVGGGGFLAYRQATMKPPPSRPEPMALNPNEEPIDVSFGLGESRQDDVDYETRDRKSFEVEVHSSGQVAAMLRYRSKWISKDEVVISVNGVEVGKVDADGIRKDRERSLRIPPGVLKKGEELNEIEFDNINNPPAEDSWKIWDVWLETIPAPIRPPEEARLEAQAAMEAAKLLCDSRGVAAENLFNCWKKYRAAWLSLGNDPKHDVQLIDLLATRMNEAGVELDRKCNMLINAVTHERNKEDPDLRKLRNQLDSVFQYFPGREHWCYDEAKYQLEELNEFFVNAGLR